MLIVSIPRGQLLGEEDIYDMSLDDILNMEVTTASKKAELISDAPAVVSVINSVEIEELGVQSLSELMSYVPGFSVSDTYWKPAIITARGVKMTLYNDKTLMLINGVPAYDAMLEHYLDVIPVNAVKRIEIIRGPGSTLYGTNAFSAVINIITWGAGSRDGQAAYMRLGSHDTRQAGASLGGSAGEVDYFFAADMRDDDGYLKEVTDEYGVTGEIQYEKDSHAFYSGLAYGDLTVNAGALFQKFGKFGPIPAFFAGNQLHRDAGKGHHQKFFINATHSIRLREHLNIRSTIHYDYIDKHSDIGSYAEQVGYHTLGIIDSTTPPDFYRFGGTVLQADLQLNYYYSGLLHLVGGFAA
ncbi:MAG: TonB-dependent receptor plug domain-containing protein, partial [Candidatus Latescibacteria bacterium]|nr:TonB-dependent receptor plug domain-containing protein [bacterium]MBD3423600.1 TonB-dependent receptor plug domain-containing protein [Candidatus Latescibacterota bacterium]